MAWPPLVPLLVALLPQMAQAAPVAPTASPPRHAIPANGDPAMPDTLTGSWTVAEVGGGPVPPGVTLTIEFATGQVTGTSGCNRYGAGVTIKIRDMTFDPARSTRMACAPEVMTVEAVFLAVLEGVRQYEIVADGTLLLFGGEMTLPPSARMVLLRAVRAGDQ